MRTRAGTPQLHPAQFVNIYQPADKKMHIFPIFIRFRSIGKIILFRSPSVVLRPSVVVRKPFFPNPFRANSVGTDYVRDFLFMS